MHKIFRGKGCCSEKKIWMNEMDLSEKWNNYRFFSEQQKKNEHF